MHTQFRALSNKLLSQDRYQQIFQQGRWLQSLLKDFTLDLDGRNDSGLSSSLVLPYGSVLSGTSFVDGDADYAISFAFLDKQSGQPEIASIARENQETVLSQLFAHIKARSNNIQLQPQRIFRARIPIIQYVRQECGEHAKFDVSLSLDGVRNSLLLRKYFSLDPRMRLGLLCAKFWGQQQRLLNARKGWISPYALSIMYIHYMQETKRTEVFCDEDSVSIRVDEIISAAMKTEGKVEQLGEFESVLPLEYADRSQVEKDVYDFFSFYGNQESFDFDVSVVDIRSRDKFRDKDQWCESLGKLDASERWNLLGHEVILLRDPFEPHNLGRSVDFFRGEEIREIFRNAAGIKPPLSFLTSC